MEERTIKVGELKQLIAESSNEFKAKLGDGVESNDKKNNEKAYKDAEERAKKFNGALVKDVVDVDPNEIKSFDKDPYGNKTTLDYEPDNVTDSYKERVKAQAHGYTSKAEEENGIEKSGEFKRNEKIYDGIKKAGKEMHQMKKDFKKSGLQASKWPDKVFDHGEMYENTNKMLTAYFKKTEFLNEEIMMNKIPDEFKENGNIFRMKDKNESEYIVEWNNNKGKVLEHTNKAGFNESVNRMKELFAYNGKDTKTNNSERVNENYNTFKRTMDLMRDVTKNNE